MVTTRSTDASVEPALDALRAQQESSMLFAAYATNATGHVTNAHTNWELGEATTDVQACDFCKVANVRCIRDSEEDMCSFCKSKSLPCVGPGNLRRKNLYEGVNQSFDNSNPTYGEYEVGQAVTARTAKGTWDTRPHQVKRVIYKPVAVILDDDNNAPVPVDAIRPFPSTAPSETSANGKSS